MQNKIIPTMNSEESKYNHISINTDLEDKRSYMTQGILPKVIDNTDIDRKSYIVNGIDITPINYFIIRLTNILDKYVAEGFVDKEYLVYLRTELFNNPSLQTHTYRIKDTLRSYKYRLGNCYWVPETLKYILEKKLPFTYIYMTKGYKAVYENILWEAKYGKFALDKSKSTRFGTALKILNENLLYGERHITLEDAERRIPFYSFIYSDKYKVSGVKNKFMQSPPNMLINIWEKTKSNDDVINILLLEIKLANSKVNNYIQSAIDVYNRYHVNNGDHNLLITDITIELLCKRKQLTLRNTIKRLIDIHGITHARSYINMIYTSAKINLVEKMAVNDCAMEINNKLKDVNLYDKYNLPTLQTEGNENVK